MVSMGPNVQHYDFTHRWVDLCKGDTCRNKPLKKLEVRKGSLLDALNTKPELSKIKRIVEMARLEHFLQMPSYYNRHTLFVTENKNIPDAFMESLDFDKARRFITAYLLKGTANTQYLLNNGDSIYTTYNNEAPMLAVVSITGKTQYIANELHRTQQPKEILKGEIIINKVGKVQNEITVDDGVIIVLDNMADL